jgi:hypothetical protein
VGLVGPKNVNQTRPKFLTSTVVNIKSTYTMHAGGCEERTYRFSCYQIYIYHVKASTKFMEGQVIKGQEIIDGMREI